MHSGHAGEVQGRAHEPRRPAHVRSAGAVGDVYIYIYIYIHISPIIYNCLCTLPRPSLIVIINITTYGRFP